MDINVGVVIWVSLFMMMCTCLGRSHIMLQIWPRITPAGPPLPLPLARSWHKQVIIINKQQLAIFQRVENVNHLYFCYNLVGPWICLTF